MSDPRALQTVSSTLTFSFWRPGKNTARVQTRGAKLKTSCSECTEGVWGMAEGRAGTLEGRVEAAASPFFWTTE